MGGTNIMHNSASINLNLLEEQRKWNEVKEVNKTRIFYSSSACMYPEYNQLDPDNPDCREESAYPAAPDSEYGWEKLFSERLYFAYHLNYGIDVRVARYHNIFDPKEPGREEKKNFPQHFVERSQNCPKKEEPSMYGVTVSKLVPSCILMNALKQHED